MSFVGVHALTMHMRVCHVGVQTCFVCTCESTCAYIEYVVFMFVCKLLCLYVSYCVLRLCVQLSMFVCVAPNVGMCVGVVGQGSCMGV